MRRWIVLLSTPLACLIAIGTAAAELTYVVDASVDLHNRRIDGSIEVHAVPSEGATEICWLLFPKRFAEAANDSRVDDFNRLLVYPEETFDAGDITVDGANVSGRFESPPGLPPEAVWIQSIEPGQSDFRLRFRTTIPHRFGTFGEFEDQLTLLGGWHPVLCDEAGSTDHLRRPPATATYQIDLRLSEPADLVLNGVDATQTTRFHYRSAAPEAAAALIIAPILERQEWQVDGTRVLVLRSVPQHTFRIGWTASPSQCLVETLDAALGALPNGLPRPPQLTVVLAPLRLQLASFAPGMVVLSDRVFHANPLIQPFHELQTASAVFADLIEPTLRRREDSDNVAWLRDGLGRDWARRWMESKDPERRSVYDWIDLFNIFAVVDRFETAPRIPFVASFFEHTAQIDPLHETFFTFNNDDVSGIVLMDKLRQAFGDDIMHPVVSMCTTGNERFADCAKRVGDVEIGSTVEMWRPSFPRVNYSIVASTFNEPANNQFRHTIRVRRDAERRLSEAVPIRLRGIGGTPTMVVWNDRNTDQDAEGTVTATTPNRIWQALIDPDRTLIETTRADNAAPFDPQLVLDTAEVEVSSTEFGFAALASLRNRYDYSKDIAVAGSYSNRAASVHAGGRIHFGTPIDANTFRNYIFGFYQVYALDSSFREKDNRDVRNAGHANGFGLRYDYSDVVESNNPKRSLHLRLFGDIYHHALASDYDFADWGIAANVTQPLFTPRTVLAAQVINGFSQAFAGSLVPVQSRFSLGGSRSIRGIGAEEKLARNLLVLRTELRQSLFPEFDHNLLDLVTARRLQVHAFVDTGNVSNSTGRVYDVSSFAVGAGVGLGLNYEIFGFFPAQAYFEVATRVDRADQLDAIQVLFGTEQSF